MFIRNVYILFIFFVEFLYDIIVWFKIDKSFCNYMKDIYIVFIYFLFSNLIFLKERDIDLFMELEN